MTDQPPPVEPATPEPAKKNPPFDPWTVPLPVLAETARHLARPTFMHMTARGGDEAKRIEAEMLLEILQARAALEAAEIGARTARRLVIATWALVAATIALAAVAIWG